MAVVSHGAPVTEPQVVATCFRPLQPFAHCILGRAHRQCPRAARCCPRSTAAVSSFWFNISIASKSEDFEIFPFHIIYSFERLNYDRYIKQALPLYLSALLRFTAVGLPHAVAAKAMRMRNAVFSVRFSKRALSKGAESAHTESEVDQEPRRWLFSELQASSTHLRRLNHGKSYDCSDARGVDCTCECCHC